MEEVEEFLQNMEYIRECEDFVLQLLNQKELL